MVGRAVDLSSLPYRCPRCEDVADFSTLDGLRKHLSTDHSYRSPKTKTGKPIPEQSGRISPLTASFLRQRKLLEEQLNQAKRNEEQLREQNRKEEQFRLAEFEKATQKQDLWSEERLKETKWNEERLKLEKREIEQLRHAREEVDQLYLSTPGWHTPSSRGSSVMPPGLTPVGGGREYLTSTRRYSDVSADLFHTAPISPLTSNDVDLSTMSVGRRRRHEARETRRRLRLQLEEPGPAVDQSTLPGQHDDRRRRERFPRRPHSPPLQEPHWNMTEALSKARGHVDAMKRTADNVVGEQSAIIEQLQHDLRERDERLGSARRQLDVLRTDRRRLLGRVADLDRTRDENTDSIARLEENVREKERHIQTKEREIADLSTFLKSAAVQEREAHDRLEAFISDLAARAHRAESALAALQLTPGLAAASAATPDSAASAPAGPSTSGGRRTGNNWPPPLQRSASAVQETFPEYTLKERPSSTQVTPTRKSFTPARRQGAGPSSEPQVNGYFGATVPHAPPSVNYSSVTTPTVSSCTVATPSLTTLSMVATPIHTPLTLGSPVRTTVSSTSDPSLLATSGYFSQLATPARPSSPTPLVNQSDKSTNTDGLSAFSFSQSSQACWADVPPCPLSPGEVIVGPFSLGMPRPFSRGYGQEIEGAESVLSDTQRSLSEHSASTPSPSDHSVTVDELYREMRKMESAVSSNPSSLRGSLSGNQRGSNGSSSPKDDLVRSELSVKSRSGTSSLSDHKGSTLNDVDHGKSHPINHVGTSQAAAVRFSPERSDYKPLKALFHVFHYLDTADLCQVALVCRQWRDLSRQPSLWRKVCLQRAALSSKFLKRISRWCSEMQSLTIEGVFGRNRRRNETKKQYKKATRGCLEAGLEELLVAAGDRLLSLRIIDCSSFLTDRCLWLASCYSRSLERVAYISDTNPVSSEVIWALGAGCRRLQTLIIPPKYPNLHPNRFTDRCLTLAAASWPNLLVVCVGGVEVTAKGLIALAKGCSRLQVLELDHMCEVMEEAAVSMCRHGLRGLQTLEFSNTPVTPRALLHFVSSCASLQSVLVKLSIRDYFRDPENPEFQQQYYDILSKLKLVQNRPGMSDIIFIRETS